MLPAEFTDAHHHFLDVANNSFQSFLGTLVPNEVYLPAAYDNDVVQPLAKAGVKMVASVHVECMPDDGVAEAEWVASMPDSTVRAIVASCDLTKPTADQELRKLKKVCGNKLRGIRWILDCVGAFDGGKTATHVATSRHDGIDYLRGSDGGYDGEVVHEFENGFALLQRHGMVFDLQCAPAQLPAAAKLVSRYPIPVVIDHLGKPRTLLGPDSEQNKNTIPNQEELCVWRHGMKEMAALPNVFVKISMLGYAVPGWIRSPERIVLMRGLVRETVQLFGPKRCIVASNFWKSPALSDADGLSEVGPDVVQLLELLTGFFDDYSEDDRHRIFSGTAKEFYSIM